MAQVSVTLVRADTNQEFDVELPDDAPLGELLPALVKELGLPATGPDGNQVAYELSNKRTGREYKEGESLGGVGTKTGDSLLLTSTFVAGGLKTEVVKSLVCDLCDAVILPHIREADLPSRTGGGIVVQYGSREVTIFFSDVKWNPRSLPNDDCTCPGTIDICQVCQRNLLSRAVVPAPSA